MVGKLLIIDVMVIVFLDYFILCIEFLVILIIMDGLINKIWNLFILIGIFGLLYEEICVKCVVINVL